MKIVIYKVISPSNKIYIGLTKDFIKRKKSHKNDAFNKKSNSYNNAIKLAIRKHGDDLKWEIIDIAKNYETAHELERRYILQFNSYNAGYNMTPGGEGISNPTKWTPNKLKAEALKYNKINHWKLDNRSSYLSAKNISKKDINWWNNITAHMDKSHGKKWTKIMIKDEINKIKPISIEEWKQMNRPSYEAAKKIKDTEWYNDIKCNISRWRLSRR